MPLVEGRNGGLMNRLEKGQSGNPKGRAPGPTWATTLKKMMDKEGLVIFENAEILGPDGKPTGQRARVRVNLPTQQKIALALLRKALEGDAKSIQMIMDRMDGKPVQPLSNDRENPISFKIIAQPPGADSRLKND